LRVQGGALVALRRGRNAPASFPEGAFFFAYFLFERKKESKKLPPCTQFPCKYTPVGCFATTSPLRHFRDVRRQETEGLINQKEGKEKAQKKG